METKPVQCARYLLFSVVLCVVMENQSAALIDSSEQTAMECRPEHIRGKDLFPEDSDGRFINVLVTRFSGQDDAAAQLGAEVAIGLARGLDNFVHSTEFRAKPDETSIIKLIRVRYVPCFIAGEHDSARRLGKSWGADLVFWGQAVCPATSQENCHMAPLSVRGGTIINNGVISTIGQKSPIYIGSPIITIRHPRVAESRGAIKTSLTVVQWHKLETVQQDSVAIKIDPKSIQNLDFPSIASAEPLKLFGFMIGVYSFLSSRYSFASDKFLEAEGAIFARVVELQPLYEIMGVSHMYAGREQHGIRLLTQALQLCYQSSIASTQKCQARSLINLGWAHAKRGRYDRALDHYAKAAELLKNEQEDVTLAPTEDARLGRIRMNSILGNNIGYAYLGIGDIEKSIIAYKKARDEAQESGLQDVLTSIFANLGYIAMRQENYVEAEKWLTSALSSYQSTIEDKGQTFQAEKQRLGLLDNTGFSCRAYDRRAERTIRKRLYGTLNSNLADAGGVVPIYINLASVLLNTKRHNAARLFLGKALALVSRMGDIRAECMVREKLRDSHAMYDENKERSWRFRDASNDYNLIETDLEMKLMRREKADNERLLRHRCGKGVFLMHGAK